MTTEGPVSVNPTAIIIKAREIAAADYGRTLLDLSVAKAENDQFRVSSKAIAEILGRVLDGELDDEERTTTLTQAKVELDALVRMGVGT